MYYKTPKMHERKALETIAGNASKNIILLIDDDEDEHEIFLSALKNTDRTFDFISADSCETALDILNKLEPDYIFIDVNMPRINGMICLERIKKINKNM